jgi:hypothetical protein
VRASSVFSIVNLQPSAGSDSTVGWVPTADSKIIEKIDEFARDQSAFVAGFVLISISKQLSHEAVGQVVFKQRAQPPEAAPA